MLKYIEQMIQVYDYIDGIAVVDLTGRVIYYFNNRPEINRLTNREIVNKHVLEVWTNLTEETSTLLRVLKTGRPLLNVKQENTTCTGDVIHSINSTMPITNLEGKLIGAVDVSVYVRPEETAKPAAIHFKENFRRAPASLYTVADIITQSASMKGIKSQIERIAHTDSSVLVSGETGCGKELVVQSIHTASKRQDGPFVAQNCAALPATLLESLLFGTVKGSFTGAENQKGLFEQAQGGTLFLDEINSMEIGLQAKILRVLEEKKLRRLGGDQDIALDIRLVSAVNQHPHRLLQDETIRSDLFFRLSPVQIFVPPLRERLEDIPLLTDHFIHHFNDLMGKSVVDVSPEVMDQFMRYQWPGNVRELKNVIEGCFNIMSGRFIHLTDLPPYLISRMDRAEAVGGSFIDLEYKVNQYEKHLLEQAVNAHQTLTKTAAALNLSKQTLRYKMAKYQLTFK